MTSREPFTPDQILYYPSGGQFEMEEKLVLKITAAFRFTTEYLMGCSVKFILCVTILTVMMLHASCYSSHPGQWFTEVPMFLLVRVGVTQIFFTVALKVFTSPTVSVRWFITTDVLNQQIQDGAHKVAVLNHRGCWAVTLTVFVFKL